MENDRLNCRGIGIGRKLNLLRTGLLRSSSTSKALSNGEYPSKNVFTNQRFGADFGKVSAAVLEENISTDSLYDEEWEKSR